MDKHFIVANLKSHMNEDEAKNWLDGFLEKTSEMDVLENKEIIIAPSFTLLSFFKSRLSKTNIKLSAQDISQFDEGAYTGEVNGRQIKNYTEYVIVGHSERRNNFNETDQILSEKVKLANKYGLKVIYCIQGEDTVTPDGVSLVAYEPLFAIGSGTPDTPDNAEKVLDAVSTKINNLTFIYGGSVNSSNVHSFMENGKIKGVLVGGASLDPHEFLEIIKNA